MSDGTPPPPPPYGGSEPEPSGHPTGATEPTSQPTSQPTGQPYGEPAGPPGATPYGQQPAPGYDQAQYGQVPGQYGAPAGARPGELLDRFVARFVDLVLIGIVNAIISLAIIGGVLGLSGGSMYGVGGSFAATAVDAIIGAAIALGYFAYMESKQGRTVGKMLMKLRVEGPDGAPPTLEQAAKRNIWVAAGVIGIIPIIGGLIGALAELVAVIMIAVGINNDPVRRQAWNDKFAGGTQVIKEG